MQCVILLSATLEAAMRCHEMDEKISVNLCDSQSQQQCQGQNVIVHPCE